MKKFYDIAVDANTGRPIAGATVRIRTQSAIGKPAGALATVYKDASGTPTDVAGQVTTGSGGYYEFYATDGYYTFEFLNGGSSLKAVTDIGIAEGVNASVQVYTPDQVLFGKSFAVGDGLRGLVSDPIHANVGGNNHAFGLGALLNLTGVTFNANPNAGYGNCAFGPNTMHDGINAFDNTAMGYETMYHITDGFNNAGFGPKALYTCTTGYRNIGVGTTSLYSLTTGYENVTSGVDCCYNITTANGNVISGYQAGYQITTGANNVGMGWKAVSGIGAAPTTGARNSGVGYRALGSVTTGSDNAAFGSNALVSMTTASGNCAFGPSSLNAVLISGANCAFGDSSLFAATGIGSCAFGSQALLAVVAATGNSAFGYQAGIALTSANNSIFGYQAGKFIVAGANNVVIGRGAAPSLVGGGSNVVIGDSADLGAANDNCIVIGSGAVGSAANQITIGNTSATAMRTAAAFTGAYNTAIPAGGSQAVALNLTSTANFGIFAGSGAPTVSAAKGSLYLRSDGSSTSTRAYINTDGGTTWTALTTAA